MGVTEASSVALCATQREKVEMKSLLFIATFLYCYISVTALDEGCKQGPHYWCKSDETARECGATNLCLFEKQSMLKKSNKIKFAPSSVSSPKLDGAPVNVTLYYESLC